MCMCCSVLLAQRAVTPPAQSSNPAGDTHASQDEQGSRAKRARALRWGQPMAPLGTDATWHLTTASLPLPPPPPHPTQTWPPAPPGLVTVPEQDGLQPWGSVSAQETCAEGADRPPHPAPARPPVHSFDSWPNQGPGAAAGRDCPAASAPGWIPSAAGDLMHSNGAGVRDAQEAAQSSETTRPMQADGKPVSKEAALAKARLLAAKFMAEAARGFRGSASQAAATAPPPPPGSFAPAPLRLSGVAPMPSLPATHTATSDHVCGSHMPLFAIISCCLTHTP
jgi:hypothetical protein